VKPVKIVIAGAGGRGQGYARYVAEHTDDAQVAGVAEPIDYRRRVVADAHHIPPGHVFTDWKDMARVPKFADAVLICTQDAMHAEPAVAFAKKGYHLLLEKPMAPTADDCKRIVRAVKKAGVIFAVCHVLRYTRYTQQLKALVTSGAVGEVMSLDHLEPVGYWHQAHAFVRGHWRNETESSPMLLSKSCHDLDWIRYILGTRCTSVSSFGSLRHFRRDQKPKGAGKRCTQCKVEPTCPYSTLKIYLRDRFEKGATGWPVGTLVDGEVTREKLTKALRTGPYGRCVYACDNDVVDHQVVNMLFENEATASFTMTAFNRARSRETRIFGTRGELFGNGSVIRHFDFLTDETKEIDTRASAGDITGGHGGGDEGLMHGFIEAVAAGDATKVLSGPDETLETHLMVFAAEEARRKNRVVNL